MYSKKKIDKRKVHIRISQVAELFWPGSDPHNALIVDPETLWRMMTPWLLRSA